MKEYSIGAISKILNISVQAIRHYQKMGLVIPSRIDQTSGYRYFNDKCLGQLWRVSNLQSAGFTLKEIKDLESKTLDQVQSLYKSKSNLLEEEIRKLTIVKNHLANTSNYIGILKSSDLSISDILIEARTGYGFDKASPGHLDAHFSNLSNIEAPFDLNHELTYQPSRHYTINDQGHLACDSLIAIIKEGQGLKPANAHIPGGRFITCKNSDPHDKSQVISKIMTYIKANNLSLRGDVIELLLLQEEIDATFTYLSEIQVAVAETTQAKTKNF